MGRAKRKSMAARIESKAVLRDVENDERLNLCLEGIKVLEQDGTRTSTHTHADAQVYNIVMD